MKQKFDVKGMTCASCAAHVEKAARKVPGVENAAVSLLENTLTAEGDFDSGRVITEVKKAGYEAYLPGSRPEGKERTGNADEKEARTRLILGLCFLVPLMYLSMGGMLGLPLPAFMQGTENALVHTISVFLVLLPILYVNRAYYRRGMKALLNGTPNMDSLVALGSLSALVYGVFSMLMMAYALGQGDTERVAALHSRLYFEGAGTVPVLVTVGKTLEARAKGKTGEAVEKLRRLAPDTALLVKDGKETEVPLSAVRPGDVLRLRTGDRAGADGTVISGHCAADESMLTGESLPVEKQEGSRLSAGTSVSSGSVLMRADRVGDDTDLAGIIRAVTDAAATKPPIARLADKIAGVFVPCVIGIALVTLGVWLILGREAGFALEKAVSVLVVSCPCARGLATPVAVTVGIGRGAENGILFRSAEAVETAGKAKFAVLDKTGTVTEGNLRVIRTDAAEENESELLRVCAALERGSAHPAAKAILEYASGVQHAQITDFEEKPGLGVSGVIDGIHCLCGNEKLMREEGIRIPARFASQQSGESAVYAARGGRLLGVLLLSDTLRAGSREAVMKMKRYGITPVMITGDRREAAERIAAGAGIDRVMSEVLPGGKEEKVREMQEQGVVLMIGDGINDAPALTRADVGMAIGRGSDIAVDSADIVLARSSLTDAVTAVLLSRAIIRNIRENLFWAFIYNLICIPLATGVLESAGISMNPMMASLAMSLSSVCVCLNALRLRFFKAERAENAAQEPHKTRTEPEPPGGVRVALKVEGMMCSHCTGTVEKILLDAGCTEVSVTLEDLTARFNAPPGTDREAILNRIRDEDYEPGEWKEETR